MRNYIEQFTQQLKESISISNGYHVTINRTVQNVVICGLGGSGIGGEIIKAWSKSSTTTPIEVSHSYDLPAYVNDNTLVIACSYSGNTEETLSALEQAIEKNAEIIGITSGGALKERLSQIGKTCIEIPGGMPPRAALAYPLVQLATVLEQLGLVTINSQSELMQAIAQIDATQEALVAQARSILDASKGRKILFYGEDRFAPVLLRACQQINENGKELAFYNVIPEMNHNEIVGWATAQNDLLVVSLRSSLEHPRNAHRLEFTERTIRSRADFLQISLPDASFISQTMIAIHILDWLSLLMAEKKGIDVEEVYVIDALKRELADLNV